MKVSDARQPASVPTATKRTLRLVPAFLAILFAIAACSTTAQDDAFTATEVAKFEQPWAMAFLPDGRLLVTEKRGALLLVAPDGSSSEVAGVPEVNFGGQGGLGDVVLHPGYADNGLVYLSYAEQGEGGSGAVVARGRLELDDGPARLTGLEVIWRQAPKVSGQGHYGHRIAFGPQGYLWISSGDRQKFDPAQDMAGNLGKILRLNDDGTVPADNPFAAAGGITAQIWSLGHRNPLGLAFDASGRLWVAEMGPRHGDELNLVEKGANYGYPIVSEGDHYDGTVIPDHATRPEFKAPAVAWVPAISPSSLTFYRGGQFPQWRGDALIGGLSSKSLLRVELDGNSAREAQRFDMGERIRAVAEGPDGAIWLLQDGKNAAGGHLIKLTAPAAPG
ncbi:MAG: PQQ-dependent sugar dehydrogenase [Halieaceae bacterium]|jgi:glucose/arabinose dehydrogenase|nr:PQQ-dependent sugar dehydrogenase [Halieaceae bacterium]